MYAKILFLLMATALLSGQVSAQTGTEASSTTPVTKSKKSKKNKKQDAKKVEATAPVAAAVEAAPTTPSVKPAETPVASAPQNFGQDILAYVKEKFSASYHGEFYFVRRDVESTNTKDHDIQDLSYMHSPTLIYKPTKNWQVLANAEFKYTDVPGGGGADGSFVNDYYRALLNLTRKNILVEKENGIQLDAGIGRRDFNTRVVPNGYGNTRIFTTLTKNYGKNNGSLFIQYLYNDPKVSSAKTWKQGLEIIPTINIQLTEKLTYLFNDDINYFLPKFKNTDNSYFISHEMNLAYLTYQWTDKVSTYYQFKYLHTEDFSNAPKEDYFAHYAGLAYAFTPKITATAEVGGDIFRHNDGKTLFTKKFKYPELALYLDASF